MFDMVIKTLALFLSCSINMKQAMLNKHKTIYKLTNLKHVLHILTLGLVCSKYTKYNNTPWKYGEWEENQR
jgi:hypothetical protein